MFWAKLILSFVWILGCSLIVFPILLIFFDRGEIFPCLIRLWGLGVLAVAGIRVVVEGEKIPDNEPSILMGNHQSGMDVIIFSSVTPKRMTMVGKKELGRIPIIGMALRRAGVILIDRSDRKQSIIQLNDAIARMRRECISVAFSPEGHRNPAAQDLLPFKKGGFHLAVNGGFPIIPLVASRMNSVANFKARTFGPGTVKIRILPRVETTGRDSDEVREEVFQSMRKAFLEMAM